MFSPSCKRTNGARRVGVSANGPSDDSVENRRLPTACEPHERHPLGLEYTKGGDHCTCSKASFWSGAYVAPSQKLVFGAAHTLRRLKSWFLERRTRCAGSEIEFWNGAYVAPGHQLSFGGLHSRARLAKSNLEAAQTLHLAVSRFLAGGDRCAGPKMDSGPGATLAPGQKLVFSRLQPNARL